MKWVNRGHEFDELYNQIKSKEKFYFFGGGDYGKQFINIIREEIELLGVIDNFQKGTLEGYPFLKLKDAKKGEKIGIIVTASQIQRITICDELNKKGYKKNINYFIIEEFLSVYFAYKHDKVYFSSISFLPSTICNLKCKHCLNFNPFAKKFYIKEVEDLKRDVDIFFKCIDRIMLFHISGGEPMLFPHIEDIFEYIAVNYKHKLDTLRTVTNGTVIPSDKVLEKIAQFGIEVTVDDYREAVPQYNENFDILLRKLEEFNIKYFINKTEKWLDLAPNATDYPQLSEEELISHFDECGQSWQELRDGKLFSCNYDAYATVAGINEEQDKEVYDLYSFNQNKRKELIEFRLGFNEKGYTNLCKHCKGFSSNSLIVPCAVQS